MYDFSDNRTKFSNSLSELENLVLISEKSYTSFFQQNEMFS